MDFNINKLMIFGSLKPEFISNIHLAFTNGYSALIVTKDDDVYAFGENNYSYMGVNSDNYPIELKRIEALCKKEIIALSSGRRHMVALTKSGKILSWGNNEYGQVGDGTIGGSRTPYLVPRHLLGNSVLDISCGSNHTLILNEYNEVYAWGYNGLNNVPTPQKVKVENTCQKVKSITCGSNFSLVLLENREIYQLGDIFKSSCFNDSKRVEFSDGVIIQKVVCGPKHALALSNDGSIYTWGSNKYGQLGNGSTNNETTPQKIAPDLGPFMEIGASYSSDISAALTQYKNCYVWGQCHGRLILYPHQIRYQSIHDAFAFYSSPAINWKPIVFMDINSSASKRSVSGLISRSFDDPQMSDFKFIVEGKKIHVHKMILRVLCSHFISMFEPHWDGGKDSVEITQYSYAAFYAFLKYIYTNQVYTNTDDLQLEDVIELHDLANSYLEFELKHESERIIKNKITVENVAILYAHAIKYDAKDFEEYCFHFIINHCTEVVKTEAFSKLEAEVVKSFVMKAADNGAFKN